MLTKKFLKSSNTNLVGGSRSSGLAFFSSFSGLSSFLTATSFFLGSSFFGGAIGLTIFEQS